jgi:hypothetical protein
MNKNKSDKSYRKRWLTEMGVAMLSSVLKKRSRDPGQHTDPESVHEY